jgi:hypothetical protein
MLFLASKNESVPTAILPRVPMQTFVTVTAKKNRQTHRAYQFFKDRYLARLAAAAPTPSLIVVVLATRHFSCFTGEDI